MDESQGVAATDAQVDGWRARGSSSRISLRQLEAFDVVASEGSITAGADRLALSQPSVTRLIADLERNVGFALFRRDRKRLAITPEGRQFWEEVNRCFTSLDRLTRFADDIRDLRAGSLHVAVVPALSLGPVPRAIARLTSDRPEISVLCEQRTSERTLVATAAEDIDVAVSLGWGRMPGVATIAQYTTECVCVMPGGHPLAGRETVGLDDLRGLRRVGLPHYTSVSLQLNKLLAEAQIDPRPQVEALISSMACAMVAENMGVSVLDPFTAAVFSGKSLVFRPFQPRVAFDFRLVRPERRMPSKLANAFIELVVQEFEADPRIRRVE
ncbi:LysR family transcriptional regulator [Amorphus sp. 3PC139-8]|uniref:LysR family transcriptional regulator n=1 Tax=Amorphus sp. 3PC139-8 TaxID=2735676 RepID=UPI00345CAAC9